ncbi:hypothetical protein HQQ80_15095 [Microbacteriaceae bacterium VKM Ac-2855]|nr:hypothetical protein [Microbacteriaceae bacterium VKM Ac-2855]
MPAEPAPDASAPNPSLLHSFALSVGDMWRDYHLPTKVVFSVLLTSIIGSLVLTTWPEIAPAPPWWVRLLFGDPFRALLTFAIAFFIAVRFYSRAREGVVAGDEHYSIARGLSFGYFKNFLVMALLYADKENRTVRIFQPRSLEELTLYDTVIAPHVRAQYRAEMVDVTANLGPHVKRSRRTILSLQSPTPTGGATPWFLFDAPSTLFTVGDFYDAINRQRMSDGKAPLANETIAEYQGGQITRFYEQLKFLFTEDSSLAGVDDIVGTVEELRRLYERRLEWVTYQQLVEELQLPPG